MLGAGGHTDEAFRRSRSLLSAVMLLLLSVRDLVAAAHSRARAGSARVTEAAGLRSQSYQDCSRLLPLRLQNFAAWDEYLRWRAFISPECARNQPVQPCVLENGRWGCLPKLVVIGAMKGGTTGLRNMLAASGRFMTRMKWSGEEGGRVIYAETQFWDALQAGEDSGERISDLEALQRWVHLAGAFPANLEWADLADENGFATRLSMDVSPKYLKELKAAAVARILRVNPDAHFLVLARDPAEAVISATRMEICSHGHRAKAERCGQVGCEFWPSMIFPERDPAEDGCDLERIPCSEFQRHLKRVASHNQRRELDYMLGGVGESDSVEGYSSEYPDTGGWRYVWPLLQQWAPVVPQGQLHVVESGLLWQEPQRMLDLLGSLLGFLPTITAVPGVQTRPDKETKCQCLDADANIEALGRVVERCNLMEGITCGYLHSNRQMLDIMRERYLYGLPKAGSGGMDWNRGLTPERCREMGFAVDVDYLVLHELVDELAGKPGKPRASALGEL